MVVGSFAMAVTVGLLPPALLVLMAWAIAVLRVSRPGLPISLYRWLTCVALGGALVASLITLYGIRLGQKGVGLIAYGGGLIVDRFSVLSAVILIVIAGVTVLLCGSFAERIRSRAAALHALVLVSTAAAIMMASQHEMIALYVSLQLLLICTAVLAGLDKTTRRSGEAALKHLVLGAAGSAVLLYGLALLYGVTGSTDLTSVAAAHNRAPVLTSIGIALSVLGLTAAVGALPLHQWIGQVSSGAPAVVAGFMATEGVIAGVMAYLRVTVGGFGAGVRPWMELTAVIAAITVLYAGLRAVRGQNLRRLAGSLILAQVGFMLMGVLSVSQGPDHRAGIVALLLYVMTMGVTAPALYGVIDVLESAGLGDGDEDHRGLGHRNGWSSLVLVAALMALGGLPPLALFIARLLVLESAVAAGFAWVVAVGAVGAVLIATGCVRFIAQMYAGGGEQARFSIRGAPRLSRVTLTVCAASAVILSALAQPLLAVSSGGAGTLPLH
ncbi:MAG: NADH-quinone oxidoreductase subunit N [Candidatus Dormibacteria bacterium]